MELTPHDNHIPYTLLRVESNDEVRSEQGIYEQLLRGFEHNYPVFLIVDLKKVNYCPSSFIAIMMEWRKKLLEANGDVVFVGLGFDLRSELSSLGIHKIFSLYPDISTALNRYSWKYADNTQKVTLSFPQRLKTVPAIRQLMSRTALAKGYNQKEAFRIETIVDEICNNAIEHGEHSNENNITISLGITKNRIEVNVHGKSDPEKIKKLKKISQAIKNKENPAPEMETTRGRGLALVKMLSDDLKIHFSTNQTSVNVTRVKEE